MQSVAIPLLGVTSPARSRIVKLKRLAPVPRMSWRRSPRRSRSPHGEVKPFAPSFGISQRWHTTASQEVAIKGAVAYIHASLACGSSENPTRDCDLSRGHNLRRQLEYHLRRSALVQHFASRLHLDQPLLLQLCRWLGVTAARVQLPCHDPHGTLVIRIGLYSNSLRYCSWVKG